jgi:hypothetical protein
MNSPLPKEFLICCIFGLLSLSNVISLVGSNKKKPSLSISLPEGERGRKFYMVTCVLIPLLPVGNAVNLVSTNLKNPHSQSLSQREREVGNEFLVLYRAFYPSSTFGRRG